MARRDYVRYETLLRVRKRQEEMKSLALAEVRREIRAAEQRREDIQRRQREVLEEACRRTAMEFRAEEVGRYYQYERHLARLAVETDAHLVQLRAVEERRRVELDEALKSRRMVEKLNEREEAAFRAVVNKKEQAALDESALNHSAVDRQG